MTSQPGNQSNAIHTLPNISRSKDNQKMKLGLLIEHHRNIFLEKSYTYCAAEAISRPFSTKSKLKISLDQHPEFLFILFYCISLLRVDEYKNILKLRCWPIAFTFYKDFLENKESFCKMNFSLNILLGFMRIHKKECIQNPVNIKDGAFSENSFCFQLFWQSLHLRCLTGFLVLMIMIGMTYMG